MFEPKFEMIHVAGIIGLRPGEKYRFTLYKDRLEVKDQRKRIPLTDILDFQLELKNTSEWSAEGKAFGVLTAFTYPLLAPLSLLMKRDKLIPLLRLQLKAPQEKTITVFLLGEEVAELYQKLLERL